VPPRGPDAADVVADELLALAERGGDTQPLEGGVFRRDRRRRAPAYANPARAWGARSEADARATIFQELPTGPTSTSV
jgi:hypothetical protein